MVEFLEKRESIKAMEGVYEVSFLFIDDGVGGSDVFEAIVCLVGYRVRRGLPGWQWVRVGISNSLLFSS